MYLYNGQRIIETRDGSGNNMVQQFIHGTQYIDELVMVRVKNKGDLYVHQDANWNVIGLTDLGGRLVERYVYTPYGELTVHQCRRVHLDAPPNTTASHLLLAFVPHWRFDLFLSTGRTEPVQSPVFNTSTLRPLRPQRLCGSIPK